MLPCHAMQDFLDDLASRVQTLQSQNSMLLVQLAGAAKAVNAAVVENQILKAELVALETGGTPSASKQSVSIQIIVNSAGLDISAATVLDHGIMRALYGIVACTHGRRGLWHATHGPCMAPLGSLSSYPCMRHFSLQPHSTILFPTMYDDEGRQCAHTSNYYLVFITQCLLGETMDI